MPPVTTTSCRPDAIISSAISIARTEEAHTLSVTPERLQELPRRMRELCSFAGYHMYGAEMPVFSHRLQMRDPYTVLFGEQRYSYQKGAG